MKKLLYLMAALPLVMTSCGEDSTSTPPPPEVKAPTIYFAQPITPMANGKAVVKLVVENFDLSAVAEEEKIEITPKLGGTALATDYELSSKKFVLSASAAVIEITVISQIFEGASKLLEMTIEAPADFKMGKNASTKITIAPRIYKTYYSFASSSVEIRNFGGAEVSITDDAGQPATLEEDTLIAFTVGAGSTAVEGEHFEYVVNDDYNPDGLCEVLMWGGAWGESSATLEIKMLKYEAGKDKLVLQLPATIEGASLGEPSSMTVNFKPAVWDVISGSYTVEKLITTKEVIRRKMLGLVNTFEGYPTENTADKITINTTSGNLTVDLQSELKNFFIGTSKITNAGVGQIADLESGGMISIPVAMFECDNCNRNFDAKSQSADKKSYVGFRLIKNDAGEDRLEMFIMDYRPTSFLQEMLAYAFKDPRPTATSSCSYVWYLLKRTN